MDPLRPPVPPPLGTTIPRPAADDGQADGGPTPTIPAAQPKDAEVARDALEERAAEIEAATRDSLKAETDARAENLAAIAAANAAADAFELQQRALASASADLAAAEQGQGGASYVDLRTAPFQRDLETEDLAEDESRTDVADASPVFDVERSMLEEHVGTADAVTSGGSDSSLASELREARAANRDAAALEDAMEEAQLEQAIVAGHSIAAASAATNAAIAVAAVAGTGSASDLQSASAGPDGSIADAAYEPRLDHAAGLVTRDASMLEEHVDEVPDPRTDIDAIADRIEVERDHATWMFGASGTAAMATFAGAGAVGAAGGAAGAAGSASSGVPIDQDRSMLEEHFQGVQGQADLGLATAPIIANVVATAAVTDALITGGAANVIGAPIVPGDEDRARLEEAFRGARRQDDGALTRPSADTDQQAGSDAPEGVKGMPTIGRDQLNTGETVDPAFQDAEAAASEATAAEQPADGESGASPTETATDIPRMDDLEVDTIGSGVLNRTEALTEHEVELPDAAREHMGMPAGMRGDNPDEEAFRAPREWSDAASEHAADPAAGAGSSGAGEGAATGAGRFGAETNGTSHPSDHGRADDDADRVLRPDDEPRAGDHGADFGSGAGAEHGRGEDHGRGGRDDRDDGELEPLA